MSEVMPPGFRPQCDTCRTWTTPAVREIVHHSGGHTFHYHDGGEMELLDPSQSGAEREALAGPGALVPLGGSLLEPLEWVLEEDDDFDDEEEANFHDG